MSKFFKALENAERERSEESAAPRPDLPPPDSADEAGPGSVPPPAAPTPAGAVPATEEAQVAEPRARQRVYGAPLSREASEPGAHRRAFGGLLEPPPADGEPGELDDHLVSLLQPTSRAAEQYRAVRLHIENLHRERGLRLVAISSPARGDGKTLSAVNLAGALAQAPDARVALVEVAVRHPGVARYLGLPAGRGLSSYLLDLAMPLEAVLAQPAGIGFGVIPAGPASSMPYELLKSPRLTALLSALRERFDYVIVDGPAVLPFPDVGLLRDLVDGFLLVVRANRTPREMVQESLAAVGGQRVLGVIFNDDERTTVEVEGGGAGWRTYLRPLGGARAA